MSDSWFYKEVVLDVLLPVLIFAINSPDTLEAKLPEGAGLIVQGAQALDPVVQNSITAILAIVFVFLITTSTPPIILGAMIDSKKKFETLRQ